MSTHWTDLFINNTEKFRKLWQYASSNVQQGNGRGKTNLNKELLRACKTITPDEKQEIMERKVDYKMEKRAGTSYQMDEKQYDDHLARIKERPFKVQLRTQKDIKFRKDPEQFEVFYVHQKLIENVLDMNEPLKEFILDSSDFHFDDNWVQMKKDLMIHHTQQITRCEKNSEMEKTTFWESLDSDFIYALSENTTAAPLNDPNKM